MKNDEVRPVRAPLFRRESAPHQPIPITAMRLPDLIELLRRGKWYVAASLLVTLTLGGVYLRYAPPSYNVMAQLLLVQRPLLSDDARLMRSDPRFLSTQAQIIESATVAEAALASLPFAPSGDSEAGIGIIASSLTATPIEDTNVMTLAYRTSHPEEGAKILESLIDAYRNYVRGIEEADLAQDSELLVRREKEQRERLAVLHQQFEDSYAASGALGEGADALTVQREMLAHLTQQLVQERTRLIELENDSEALGVDVAEVPRSKAGSWVQLREDLWRAESKAAALRGSYGNKHPEVVAMAKQIAALKKQLATAVAHERHGLELELRAARRSEKRLQEAYQVELEKARAIGAQRLEHEQLREEIERVRQIHEATLSKLRDAELTEQGLDGGRSKVAIHVLQAPSPPEEKMWPIPALVLGPCAAIGLVAGLGITWIALPQFTPRRQGETSGAAVSTISAADAVTGRSG